MELHRVWERQVDNAHDRLESTRGDNEKAKAQKSLDKLLKREPSKPRFEDKVPCRVDSRTGRIERGGNSFPLWIHISTLVKYQPIDIPLNPSCHHLKQIEGSEIDDFEIVKHGRKYYVHISISKEIPEMQTSSIGGIDQGLNRTIAVVLLPPPGRAIPQGELICDSEKRDLIDKYDDIIASCQEHGATRKLKQLRNKRSNVAIYHDWCLAKLVAKYTEGYYIAIGNTRFRQGQYRGNGMPGLRKRIGKWSYGRQRQCIALKRAELGYNTMLIDERYTSKTCHACGSRLVHRAWLDELSYIKCHSCGLKDDADLNAAQNIALRCRDDRLKVQMTPVENRVSA